MKRICIQCGKVPRVTTHYVTCDCYRMVRPRDEEPEMWMLAPDGTLVVYDEERL